MPKLAITIIKATAACLSIVGATTAPEDAAGLLREIASVIEGGGSLVLWLIAIVFGGWAVFDILRWTSERFPKRVAAPPVRPEAKTELQGTGDVRGIQVVNRRWWQRLPWGDIGYSIFGIVFVASIIGAIFFVAMLITLGVRAGMQILP